MASQSKTQLVGKIHGLLRKEYKPGPPVERMSVLEAVVYAICHEGAAREQANQALSRFKDQFFDWNEVRVSSLEEIQATLADLPDRESRAFRIRRFLRQLFSKTFGFSLEALAKKPQKEAIKILGEYEALASDYVEASVVLYSLGGHAIPLDAPALRALVRLGLSEVEAEPKAVRSLLEHAIPKNRGSEVLDLLEDLTQSVCIETEPLCPKCGLKKICPTSSKRDAEQLAAAKAAKSHPAGKSSARKPDPKKAAPPAAAAPKSRASAPSKAVAKAEKPAEKPAKKPAPKKAARPK